MDSILNLDHLLWMTISTQKSPPCLADHLSFNWNVLFYCHSMFLWHFIYQNQIKIIILLQVYIYSSSEYCLYQYIFFSFFLLTKQHILFYFDSYIIAIQTWKTPKYSVLIIFFYCICNYNIPYISWNLGEFLFKLWVLLIIRCTFIFCWHKIFLIYW